MRLKFFIFVFIKQGDKIVMGCLRGLCYYYFQKFEGYNERLFVLNVIKVGIRVVDF